MKKFSSNKDIAKLVRKLVKQGWQIECGKKHQKIVHPNGKKTSIPCTPSDHRAFMNFTHDIIRLKKHCSLKDIPR